MVACLFWTLGVQKKVKLLLRLLIKSYLSSRSVFLKNGIIQVGKNITKGCPQGSVLGPILWNAGLDSFFNGPLREIEGVTEIGYADDIGILVEADSENSLNNKLQFCVDALNQWCGSMKLSLSERKTKIMCHKPIWKNYNKINIRLNDKKIKFVDEYKYLGVIIDNKLSMQPHVNYVCKKAIALVGSLRRKAKASWDIDLFQSMERIYKGAIVPIVGYASEFWIEKIGKNSVQSRLLSCYGICCRTMTKGYASVSSMGAGVLAGIHPLDLEIVWLNAWKTLKKGNSAIFCGKTFNPKDFKYTLEHT